MFGVAMAFAAMALTALPHTHGFCVGSGACVSPTVPPESCLEQSGDCMRGTCVPFNKPSGTPCQCTASGKMGTCSGTADECRCPTTRPLSMFSGGVLRTESTPTTTRPITSTSTSPATVSSATASPQQATPREPQASSAAPATTTTTNAQAQSTQASSERERARNDAALEGFQIGVLVGASGLALLLVGAGVAVCHSKRNKSTSKTEPTTASANSELIYDAPPSVVALESSRGSIAHYGVAPGSDSGYEAPDSTLGL